LLTLLAAASCLAQDTAALAGKWNMRSKTGGAPSQWTLVLKDARETVTEFLATGESE